MAVKITNNSINGIHGLVELVADSLEEITNPNNVTAANCVMGSRAIILSDDGVKVYMKNGDKEWVEI